MEDTMLKYLLLLLLIPSVSFAEHWAVGAWNCRPWGAIRIFEDGYAVDVNPDGELQNWGVWQNHDADSIIIVWLDSDLIEIIEARPDNKFYRQCCYGFGIGSEVEETKKILKDK
jgi:hypothetical protein